MWHLTEEAHLTFETEDLQLEGLLCRMPGRKAVIVSHPHSLYGGDMYNPVVETICRMYGEKGFTTLRFNFRGVGRSGGQFGDGIDEVEDVRGAIHFLVKSGLEEIHLAGYSFGARVLAGLHDLPGEVAAQVHVAPPVAFMEYSDVGKIDRLSLVVAGEHDEVAPPELIRAQLDGWSLQARLVVVPGADHFFSNTMGDLEDTLRKHLV